MDSVRSMTGQGLGRSESELGTVTVELRSVNQRGLKISSRLSDSLSALESRFEQFIRVKIQRGALNANATFSPAKPSAAADIHVPTVTAYALQLLKVQESVGGNTTIDLANLLELPGALAIGERTTVDSESLWPLLEAATMGAIESLDTMRLAEGAAMAIQLRYETGSIRRLLNQIVTLAPRVVDAYRQRLESKIRRAMTEHELEFSPNDLLREVHLFADRSDISEETTRLASHLQMFESTLASADASGRKLDFIVQEMFRESNTIGSKSADAEISAFVVEIKCSIERIRELIQNVQ